MWTGCEVGTSRGLLRTRQLKFALHKMLDVSQEGLSCMELVGYISFHFRVLTSQKAHCIMFRNPKVHRFSILIPKPLPVRLEAALLTPGFGTLVFAIKLYLCLIKHCTVKTYGALDGGEWSASLHCRYIPGERAPGTYLLKGWLGPRARLKAEDINVLCPLRTESRFLGLPVLLRSSSRCRLSYPRSISYVCIYMFPIVNPIGNSRRYCEMYSEFLPVHTVATTSKQRT
jgi:hypothetical protein